MNSGESLGKKAISAMIAENKKLRLDKIRLTNDVLRLGRGELLTEIEGTLKVINKKLGQGVATVDTVLAIEVINDLIIKINQARK